MNPWTSRQFGQVVENLKAECPQDAWDDLLMRYAVLKEKGPLCGGLVAKKLKNGKGIWELLGHGAHSQPRLLLYFRDNPREIVFVHGFMKKGSNYQHAIEVAQKRRKQIEDRKKTPNAITGLESRTH